MTKQEELSLFLEKADELISSKYIIAEIKIVNLLKAISVSETILAIFKNCLTDFDIASAKKKYLAPSKYLQENKGEFILPDNSRELLAFVFSVLVEIDAKRIDFGEFLNKYFYEDGSYSASYSAFINSMIKPFVNSMKVLMESVLMGSVQDPVEALVQEEKRRAEEKLNEENRKKAEEELLRKSYGKSVKMIKDLLLKNKTKIKESGLKDKQKEELTLVVNMLANVIDSEDKDAIYYAFVAYKYVAKAHKIIFFRKVRKISKYLGDILREI